MSMIKWTSPCSLSALVLSVVAVSGCTTATRFVDYQEQRLYSGNNTGGMDYVEIGPATASSSGYVWDSCEALQQEALQALRDEADEHGANTIFNVRWVNHSDGTMDDTPLCTTRWGWFTGFGVAGLGPWVKVTEARGKLAYVDASTRDELNSAADQYQAQLQEQEPQKDEEPAPEDVDTGDRDNKDEPPASDADNSDGEKAGEDAAGESTAADEADASDAAATDTESAPEAPETEAVEASGESGTDAGAESDAGAQDDNGNTEEE